MILYQTIYNITSYLSVMGAIFKKNLDFTLTPSLQQLLSLFLKNVKYVIQTFNFMTK